MNKNLPSLVANAIADILGAFQIPGASTLGMLSGAAIEELLAKRVENARKIIIEELAHARRPLEDVHERDEIVAIVYRYLDAARQGAARLNLRLLAKVASGQVEREEIRADVFLRHAEMLSSLAREEVIFLATLHRHFAQAHARDNIAVYREVEEAIVAAVGCERGEVKAIAAALQRTGMLMPIHPHLVGGAGYYVEPSQALCRVIALASFEDALRDEAKG